MKITTQIITIPALAIAIAIGGCSRRASKGPEAGAEEGGRTEDASASDGKTATATATLQALGDSGVSGTLTFTEVHGGVQVEGTIKGLPPRTKHGFHVHEVGDCSSPDGKSTGGHFNPMTVDHGAIDGDPSHVGDLGNVAADDAGTATVSVLKRGASLTSGVTNIAGRGLILHADEDDLTSQPTGAAGARVACAVIEISDG